MSILLDGNFRLDSCQSVWKWPNLQSCEDFYFLYDCLAMVSHITFPCHCLADSAPITRAWKYNTVSLLSKDLTWNAGHDFHAKWKILTENEKKMIRLSSRLTKTSCWMLLRRNGRFNVLTKISFLGQKIFQKKTPKICLKTDIYLGKGYFFLCTTLPGRGKNMVRV